MSTDHDVIILGSGIAGGFLARQLKLTLPELRVRVLEAVTEIVDYKVGESTVEVSSSYMIRRLGLNAYLYQHQLPKNGLRFFFDSAEKDLPLTEMSEMGSDHLPFHPSFQLERASLERDLVAMNRAAGVEVELGAKVVDVTIDPAEGHTVAWEQEANGQRLTARTRWVFDASGRRQVLSRKLGHKITKEARLQTGAVWARFRNVAGLDAVSDGPWRARVRHTSRHLSTNHFMYDGYWIWFIPLAGDLMSVGVVVDKSRFEGGPRTKDEMIAFLAKHRAPRELLEGAVLEDFGSYTHLPFHSDTYFSTDRWALTGEAGAFTDPFYSPGSDFIATANELITALVVADSAEQKADLKAAPNGELKAKPEPEFKPEPETSATPREELTALANAFYKLKYESSLALYVKQYAIFGSFEVFHLKYRLDFHNYYNLVYWPFLADKLTDADWLKEELRFAELQLRAVNAFGDHFARLGDALHAKGRYYAENRGRFLNGLDGVAQLQPKLGPTLDADYRKAELDRVYATVFVEVVERTLGLSDLVGRARVRRELSLPVVLALKQIDETSLTRLLQRVAARLTRELRDRFPNEGVERVTLDASPVPEGHAPAALESRPRRRITLDVVGARDNAREAILEHARSLWDERDGI